MLLGVDRDLCLATFCKLAPESIERSTAQGLCLETLASNLHTRPSLATARGQPQKFGRCSDAAPSWQYRYGGRKP